MHHSSFSAVCTNVADLTFLSMLHMYMDRCFNIKLGHYVVIYVPSWLLV